MRRIVVTEFLTLDGVMEAPNLWSFPYWNDDIAKFKFEELMASDALLLGRITYEGFAAAWPSMKDEQGFADRMNGVVKYLVSTTLDTGSWNNTQIIKANVVDELSRLKQQPGQDMLVGGSANLIQTLIKHDLVDEYRLLVYPVVRGSGVRLFQDGTQTSLKLVEAKPLGSVTALRYQPDRTAKS